LTSTPFKLSYDHVDIGLASTAIPAALNLFVLLAAAALTGLLSAPAVVANPAFPPSDL
jgi:hypothetical protein